jgi:HPt (histidine-containing phosphotransfer) domain-containing protein
MDDYLSKPFTQTQLSALLGRWMSMPLSGARQAPAAAPAATAPADDVQPGRGIINTHALDNIRALSADRGAVLVRRVVGAFIDDSPQQFASLQTALAGADAGALRKIAHSLKSSSANVGAEALAQLCKDLELLGRSNTTEGAAGILADMAHEYQAVRLSLSAILEKEI